MKNPKPILFGVALVCFALLGVALYLQIVERMQPCPLCIIQRYAFAAIALICLVFAFLPRGTSATGAGFAALVALAGAGTASWHLWVMAHPEISCGVDPLETFLNTLPPANWLPLVFKADGFCSTPYAPILGLSIPQWSLAWFAGFVLVLGRITFKRGR